MLSFHHHPSSTDAFRTLAPKKTSKSSHQTSKLSDSALSKALYHWNGQHVMNKYTDLFITWSPIWFVSSYGPPLRTFHEALIPHFNHTLCHMSFTTITKSLPFNSNAPKSGLQMVQILPMQFMFTCKFPISAALTSKLMWATNVGRYALNLSLNPVTPQIEMEQDESVAWPPA